MKKQILVSFLFLSMFLSACSIFDSQGMSKQHVLSTPAREAQLISGNNVNYNDNIKEVSIEDVYNEPARYQGAGVYQGENQKTRREVIETEQTQNGYLNSDINFKKDVQVTEEFPNQYMYSMTGPVSPELSYSAENEYYKEEQKKKKIKQEAIKKYHRDRDNIEYVNTLRTRGLDARVDKRGIIINLEDALFEFNSAELTPDAMVAVKEIANFIKRINKREIAVEGHTDSVGTVMFNKHLSEQRASNVANELVANGVSKRIISSRGYGEGDPIATNRTEEGRTKNRRVEIIIKQE